MDHELAWGNSGNISARLTDDTFLISATGTYMENLALTDFAECGITNDNVFGERKPSKEVPMHRGIYEARPETQVILHSSPFYSTMIACSDITPPSELYIESMYYLENIERVGYYHPGSQELGNAVKEKSAKANCIILDNHGVIVFDRSFKEARMRLQTFEMVCRMLILSKSSNIPLNKMSSEVVSDFLNNSGYKPRYPGR